MVAYGKYKCGLTPTVVSFTFLVLHVHLTCVIDVIIMSTRHKVQEHRNNLTNNYHLPNSFETYTHSTYLR